MDQSNEAAHLIDCALPYWLKGEDRQNFGDYLTEFFMDRMFHGVGLPAKVTRIVGSITDDGMLEGHAGADLSLTGSRTAKTIFWGCGLRDENSLGEDARNQCTILSVRGPLSRSALRLGVNIPIGDPALLLPALYSPKPVAALNGRKVVVPHFNDARADEELLSLTGCDVVLRPGISRSLSAIEDFIDLLTSAEFVLAGALHAAIVAAAYGTPFAFWDSGQIDVPFKWRDFSASVGINCAFHATVGAAETYYENEIKNALRIPPLLPMLSAAPFPVRQNALIRIVGVEIERHGIEILRNYCGTEIQSALAAETRAVPTRLLTALLGQSRLEEKARLLADRVSEDEQRVATLTSKVSDTLRLCDAAVYKVQQLESQLAERQMAERTLELEISKLSGERLDFGRNLDKVLRRPWKPFEYYAVYLLLKVLATVAEPFSPSASARFKRSARKRNPKRIKRWLASLNDVRSSSDAEKLRFAALDPNKLKIARRILVADYRVPQPDVSAGEKATVGMLTDLCALGYDVTFISTGMQESPVYDRALRRLGVTVINKSSGYDWADNYIEKEGHSFGAFYLIRVDVAEICLPVARRVAPKARIIFHAPDLYFLRETREAELNQDSGALAKAKVTRDRELAMMRSADRVVLVSQAEEPFLRAVLPDVRISVFPALYTPVTHDPAGFSTRHDIFFLGGFKHPPNVSAVLWFAANVWPLVREALPDVIFNIVGAEMPPEVVALGQSPGVRVVGYVADLAPILNSSRLGVAPLLYGAGIKGKVAMTMGAGIPSVCTTIAAEGMGIVDGVHARVADDPRAFAEAIVSLYTDETLWTRISLNGRALVQERFGEGANRASYLSVLNEARVLPIPLFIEHCQKSAPLAPPVYDPSIVPDVSIIVPVYNKWNLTRACLNSIVLTSADSGLRYEIILADDGSSDETAVAAEIFPGLRVARTPVNLGFLRNCNNAAVQARGRYLVLLNNDTIVLPGWLKALYRAMENDADIAIAGSKLLYPDGFVQEAGGALFDDGSAINTGQGLERDAPIVNRPREVDYISGASIIIRSDFWKKVGGFDERYKNAYCEDSDLAMQARAEGFYVSYQPASEVIHFEHQSYLDEVGSNPQELQKHNNAVLLDKWRDVFAKHHLTREEWRLATRRDSSQFPRLRNRRADNAGSRPTSAS